MSGREEPRQRPDGSPPSIGGSPPSIGGPPPSISGPPPSFGGVAFVVALVLAVAVWMALQGRNTQKLVVEGRHTEGAEKRVEAKDTQAVQPPENAPAERRPR